MVVTDGAGIGGAGGDKSSSDSARRLQSALGDDYEVGGLLGRGGFAEVFVAWDRRLRREVAIKTIRVELASSEEYLERFRREAEAVGRLRHPHIVPVYSVGSAEGVAWLIMPKIGGESLGAVLERETRFGFAEVVRILREAAGALAEAHRNDIVHRDIKPENIMLDGPERRVIVMDFGIAKSADPSAASEGLTATGILVGSPHYMSPEQAMGDRQADPKSDQYSLAIVGYRLLTGRLPFESDSLQGLLQQHLIGELTPVRERRPDVPPTLARIIERALSKLASERFPSMDEFGDALRRVASEVAGEFRVGRHQPSLAQRWANARARLLDAPRWSPLVAMIAFAAFLAAYPRAQPREARIAAGMRPEALFIAKNWLRSEFGDADLPYRAEFVNNTRLFDVAQRALPPESLSVRLARDLHPWTWNFNFVSPERAQTFWVSVAPDRRVYRTERLYRREPPGLVDVSDSVAAVLQWSVLRAHEWEDSLLVRERQSALPSDGIVRRTTTWSAPSRTLIAGVDTVPFRVSVATVGSELRSYREYHDLDPEVRIDLRPATESLLLSLFLFAMLAIFLSALGIAISRVERDTLQWRIGGALSVVGLFLMLFGYRIPLALLEVVSSYPTESAALDRVMQSIFASADEVLAMAAFLGIVFIAAESRLNEKRPDLTLGLADVSRGRLLIPEMVPAAVSGYIFACLVLGISFSAAALLHEWGGVPLPGRLYLAWTFDIGLPVLSVFYFAVFAILFVVTALFLFGLLANVRPAVAAPAVAATMTVLFGMFWIGGNLPGSDAPYPRLVLLALSVGALAWFVNRRGALAGMIGAFVAYGTPLVADLLWAGGDAFFIHGLLGAGILLSPALVAFAAHRRRPRVTA